MPRRNPLLVRLARPLVRAIDRLLESAVPSDPAEPTPAELSDDLRRHRRLVIAVVAAMNAAAVTVWVAGIFVESVTRFILGLLVVWLAMGGAVLFNLTFHPTSKYRRRTR